MRHFGPVLLVGVALVAGACGDSEVTADASSAAADAGGADAGGGADDAAPADSGVGCSVGGVAGVCKEVAACTGDFEATPGLCPGPAEIQCCTPLDGAACVAEDMPQPNAGLGEGAGSGGCLAGMLRVTSFCIDRYEAALVVVADDSPWSPFHNPGSTPVRAVSLAGAVPQGYFSGVQAAAACEAAGKRLCTDAEWLRACRGPADRIYPYGDTRDPGVCNDARAVHPAVEYFGTSADWIWSMLGHPCINQLPDSLATTGDHAACVTVEGAFDMMGNLHEWTADPAGTFRGGYYVDTVINGEGCLYATTAHNTAHWDYSTGFRCCADPL